MRKLLHSLSVVLIAASVLGCTGDSFSQKSASTEYVPSMGSAPDTLRELSEMASRYKLDASQRREIKPILESRAEDLNMIANDSRFSASQRGERVQELRRICNREIEAVLHDRQRVLFDRDQK